MKVENYNLPDFICIGAPKSGTSALYDYLGKVEEIALHKKLKEPNYLFIRQLNEKTKQKMDFSSSIDNFDDYVSFYNQNQENITGDISPNYLQFPEITLKSIKELYKDKISQVKIIVVLRNPIDRMVSHYNMFLREELEDKPFLEAIYNKEVQRLLKEDMFQLYKNRWPVNNFDYFKSSDYYNNLKPFYDVLPKENIKVVLFDKFIVDTYDTLDDILKFLGINKKYNRNQKLGVVGQGGKVKGKYKTIHNLFTKKSIIKEIVKPFIPFSIRKNIKSSILENKSMYEKYKLPFDTRKELYNKHFKEDIEKLEKLIDIDLSHWKVS